MRELVLPSLALTLVLLLLAVSAPARELVGETPNGDRYILDKMLVIIKPDQPLLSTDNAVSGIALSGVRDLDALNTKHQVTRIEPFYKGKLKSPVLRELMDRFYIFTVSSGEDIFEVIEEYRQDGYLECAEPYIIPVLDYVPNDPSLEDQWGLEKIDAVDAWDYVRGDKTKVAKVGISDTGVYWYHPDLEDNMWINEPEDINHNGRFDNFPDYQGGDLNYDDDDGNGYPDDVLGWDCADNDPDPAEPSPIHGTHVAGCASEVTDNGEGGGGIGFSARIIAGKGGNSSGQLTAVYQAITYCSDQGADVVNCSWGSGSYYYAYQQTINRAYDNGTQVVASAGNENNSYLRYPASYEHVISVAATDQNDHKADFSSYGDSVDVSAPGVNIYSTWGESSYAYLQGTSMAAPITSGTLALLVAQDTLRTPDDLTQIIKATTDSIDHLNPSYRGQLGTGRINAYRAIGGDNFPYLTLGDIVVREVSGDGDGVLNPGETGTIVVTISNAGADGINVVGTLRGDSNMVMIDSVTTFGLIPNGGEVNNSSDPFRLSINGEALMGPVEMTLHLSFDPDGAVDRYFDLVISLYQANWPVTLSGYIESSPAVADIDQDNYYEIVVGCYNDSLYVFNPDASRFSGWPVRLGADILGAPAVGDLDGNPSVLEVVAIDKSGGLYAYSYDGQLLAGFPVDLSGMVFSSPALGDFNGDGVLEIVATTYESSYTGRLYVVDGGGTVLVDTTAGTFWGSPAIGDLDGDDVNEIACASLDSNLYVFEADGSGGGWSYKFADRIYATPAIGDIDADDDLEVVVADNSGRVVAFEGDGTPMAGWDNVYAGTDDIRSILTVANLDDDPELEVIVASYNDSVYVFDHDGGVHTGWPQAADAYLTCNPLVCDLDGDSQKDVIVVDAKAKIFAWGEDGHLLPSCPMDVGSVTLNCTPSIFHLERDGDLEIVIGMKDQVNNLAVIDYKYTASKDYFEWITFGHDQGRTHNHEIEYDYPPTSAWEERGPELPLKFSLAQNYPNPFNPVTTIQFALPVPTQASLVVYNLLGQEVVTLLDEKLPAGYHQVNWRGENNSGAEVSSGIYFYRLEATDFVQTRGMLLLR
jgi:hypothetical protein